MRTRAGPMQLPVRDRGLRQLLVFGELPHERQETALLRTLLPRLTAFIDIGANVGWYSRLADQLLPPHGRLVAVEADPRLHPLLRANAPRAEVVGALVGDHDGTGVLYQASSCDLSSAVRTVGRPVTRPAVSLDVLCTARELQPDFVKCDVEGGEPAVLRGARRLRQGPRPPSWLIEVDERFLAEGGSSLAELQAELAGTSLWRVADGRWRPLEDLRELTGCGHGNVLAVPPDRRAELASWLPT